MTKYSSGIYSEESHYYTVIIPWSEQPTKWHPTESKGPFSVLSRGAFKTEALAHEWAAEHLAGQPYSVKNSRSWT